MIEALIDYGLFLAKALTLVLLIGALLMVLLRTRGRFHVDGDRLEVIDLKGKYRDMARALKLGSLPKKAAVKALKEERKSRKRHD